MPEVQEAADAVDTITYPEINDMPTLQIGTWRGGEVRRLNVIGGGRGFDGAIYGVYGNSLIGVRQRVMRTELPDHRNGQQSVCACLALLNGMGEAFSYYEVIGPFSIKPIS